MPFPFTSPEWLTSVTRSEVECYLRFLQSLNELERRIYVFSEVRLTSSGELAPLLGATDVYVKKIGMCGSDQPIVIPTSETVEALVREIREQWKNAAAESVSIPSARSGRRTFEIECSVRALFADILFNIEIEAELTVDMATQARMIGSLMMDIEVGNQLAQRWLNSRPLPLKGPLPRKLSSFEQKIGGWYSKGKFVPCKSLRAYAA